MSNELKKTYEIRALDSKTTARFCAVLSLVHAILTATLQVGGHLLRPQVSSVGFFWGIVLGLLLSIFVGYLSGLILSKVYNFVSNKYGGINVSLSEKSSLNVVE